MILTTEAERDEYRYGDKGRCTAITEIPSATGTTPAVVRCQASAYHKRPYHFHRPGNGTNIKWRGQGSSVALGWPSLPNRY